MTPEELRDHINQLRELLDGLENFTRLRSEVIAHIERDPQAFTIVEATLGTHEDITFTVPLSELTPLLTRRIEHFERKIGELK